MLTYFSGWQTDWALNKLTVRFVASFLRTDIGQILTSSATFTEHDVWIADVQTELQQLVWYENNWWPYVYLPDIFEFIFYNNRWIYAKLNEFQDV